jgi:hypothetical protein
MSGYSMLQLSAFRHVRTFLVSYCWTGDEMSHPQWSLRYYRIKSIFWQRLGLAKILYFHRA